MTIKPIYLEPDEEITSVIDKISTLSDRHVAVVVPKNSALFKSLINLKLLAKEAKEHDKEISIITSNKVGQRLATQVGLKTYASLASAPSTLKIAEEAVKPSVAEDPEETVDGVKVNRYRGPAGESEEEDLAEAAVADEAIAGVAGEAEKESVKQADLNSELDKIAEPKDNLGKNDNFTTKEISSHSDEPDKFPVVSDIDHDKEGIAESIKDADTDHESAEAEDLPAVVSRSGSAYHERADFKVPWVALGIAAGIVVVLCALVFVFVPRATVTVTFPAKTISKTLAVDVSASSNNQNLSITGTQITSDKTVTQTINSSGTLDIGSKATGTITITNEYKNSSGAGQSETLSSGATIKDTSSGQTYTLDNTVTIGKLTYNSTTGAPIYQSQTDTVTAVSSGSAGNIAASTFTCSSAIANTVIQSSSAFTGGVSKVVKVLTQSDVDSAMAALQTQAAAQTSADLKTQAGKKTLLSGSTWQISLKQSTDHNVGDQTDTAVATYELSVGAIVYDPTAELNAIKGDLSSNLKSGEQLILDASNVTNTFSALNDPKTDMTVSAAVQAYTIENVSQSTLAHAISGKSTSSMATVLKNNYGATKAVAVFHPSWWPNQLPVLSHFITIKFDFVQSK